MMGQLAGVSLKAIRQIEQGEEDHVNVGALKRILACFALSVSAVEDTSLSVHTNRIMPRDELIEKLKSIGTAITKPYEIQRIRLFGSYAREEAKDDSERLHYDAIIKQTITKKFNEIPWAEVRAIRNRSSHNYFSIDPNIIWRYINEELPAIEAGIRNILKQRYRIADVQDYTDWFASTP